MSWWDNRRRLRLWQQALEPCKVDQVETSEFWDRQPRLTARSESIELRITRAGDSGGRVAVVIGGPEELSDLELCSRLLHASTDCCESLEIGDGGLRVEVSEEDLPRILAVLFNIGRRFAEPLDAKSRLLHKARRDPDPEVRLYNLLVLIREHRGDPDTLEVLRGACIDPISKVRARAAIELGDEGRDVLLRVAERSSDDASCVLAVSHLGGTLPVERLRDILTRALRRGARAPLHQTALACLELLGHRGATDILARVMTEEKGELAIAAVQALGAAGDRAAEPHLLQALESEDEDLREAAAAALGRAGTAAAVQPLREAAERWLDFGFHRIAHRAIAEIQSRLEGAAPGQLSLASSEAGQLSLAQSEAGQLSLADDPAGKMSLAQTDNSPPVRRI